MVPLQDIARDCIISRRIAVVFARAIFASRRLPFFKSRGAPTESPPTVPQTHAAPCDQSPIVGTAHVILPLSAGALSCLGRASQVFLGGKERGVREAQRGHEGSKDLRRGDNCALEFLIVRGTATGCRAEVARSRNTAAYCRFRSFASRATGVTPREVKSTSRPLMVSTFS
jgi:hypothetical protein